MRYVLTLLFLWLAPSAAAELVGVPGTRVSLSPPAGFVPAADFPGFVNARARASITVSEVPASLLELLDGYSDSALATKGMEDLVRESFEMDGLRAQIVRGEQGLGARRLVKIILLTGDINESVIVTGAYIKRHGTQIDTDLYRSLRGAHWDSTRQLDHFEGMGFSMKEVPGLRVATRVGGSIIFTRDGRMPDQYYTGQMLVVGWADGEASRVSDRRGFAERRFYDIELLSDLKIDNTEAVNMAGLSGFETVGIGNHRHLGFETAAFQAALFDGERIFMAQGFAAAKDREKSYGQFRTVITTLSTDD